MLKVKVRDLEVPTLTAPKEPEVEPKLNAVATEKLAVTAILVVPAVIVQVGVLPEHAPDQAANSELD